MKQMKGLIQISLLAGWMLITASESIYAESEPSGNGGELVHKGEAFFNEEVLPKLAENGCLSCHAVGYLRPNVTVYEELLRRLAIGDSPENNAVIYKIANLRSIAPDRPNHPGGQRCESIDSEPCKTIRQWWRIEFGGGERDR